MQDNPISTIEQEEKLSENVQSPMPEDVQSITNHKKLQNKKHLKTILGKKLSFGTNHLTVKKLSDKLISISEIQNGVNHDHKRHQLINVVDYIEYKRTILSRNNLNILDISKQSPLYRQQFDNVNETQDEIDYLIKLAFEEAKCKINYTLKFHNDAIDIHLETGKIMSIIFRFATNSGKLGFTHNIDLSNAFNAESFSVMSMVTSIGRLCCSTDYKNAIELFNFCKRLHIGYNQLEKLQSFDETIDTDETMIEDIKGFIENGETQSMYKYFIEDYAYNDKTYQRFFQLRKITRVRTVVELVAINIDDKDDMIVEYRSVIAKISHNITDNTNKIIQIYNAIK